MVRIGKAITIWNEEYHSVCSFICPTDISEKALMEREKAIYNALATDDLETAEDNVLKVVSGSELSRKFYIYHVEVGLEDFEDDDDFDDDDDDYEDE